MNVRSVCIFLAASLFVTACENASIAQQVRRAQPQKDIHPTWKTVKGMLASTVESLESAARALEEIDRLTAQKTVSLDTSLQSAETAYLLGATSKAITIMEEVVRTHPTEKMPGVQFPICVVGNLWIGTFARYAGDVNRAEAAYRDVLIALKARAEIRDPSVLAAICYLYLAEIETHFRNNPEKAALLLKELTTLPHPKDQQGDVIFRVYLAWGQHQLASLEPKAPPTKGMFALVQPPYGDWSVMPILHLTLIGLGDPADLKRHLGAANANFFGLSLKGVLRSRTSPLDTSFSQFALGFEHERTKNFAAARTYYTHLFAGDSFLAPQGGIALSRCWNIDGKITEAKQILDDVARRFPTHKVLTTQLSEKWFTTPKAK